ncbi:hypothetical protein BH24ACT5_BH24ACT5_17730 [soil metagenome]
MTEIPEHLLKRSRDRRSALGLGGDSGSDDSAPASDTTPAASCDATPAATADAAPAAAAPTGPAARKAAAAPAAPPPPKPDPAYVRAAKTRAKIPFWAMAGLAMLTVWMFMYVRSVTAPPVEAAGPLGVGAEVYGSCTSCHGAAGEGGTGRPFYNGEVNLTFPHIEDQLRFVYFGSAAYQAAGVEIYGNPERAGGPHLTGSLAGGMPPQGSAAGGSLTDAQILAVVCHERYDFNGPDPADAAVATEFEDWCSEESPLFQAVEAGTPLADLDTAGIADVEIIDIGTEPAPGRAP